MLPRLYSSIYLWFKIKSKFKLIILVLIISLFILASLLSYYFNVEYNSIKNIANSFRSYNSQLEIKIQTLISEIENIKKEDQYIKNQKLEKEIKDINLTYKSASNLFERIIDLRDISKVNTSKLDETFIKSLSNLSDRKYSTAEGLLAELEKQIKAEEEKIALAQQQARAAASTAPKITPIPVSIDNNLPQSGYKRQNVQTERGTFLVDIIAADLNVTKIIVDTASNEDCLNNCPVLPLTDYISRNNAIAGINGSYFCPASYPSCVNKTNSFDTLLMNKNKVYFNVSNNVNSYVPLAVFAPNSTKFLNYTKDWSRDTNIDAAIANYPLMIQNNQILFTGSSDPKHNSKGPRGFVASKNNFVYIGVVYNATLLDSTKVLATLSVNNALNLDSGGSTALWYNGYKAGPGRNIPNVILFVKR